MTDMLTVRPDPDNPPATVVDHNGIPFVYVYPTTWDDKWTWVSRCIPDIPGVFDTEVEAWANIRFVANLITNSREMARQLVAICDAKEPPMTDTTTTDAKMPMLEEHQLFTIEKMLDEYSDADNTIPAIAWRRLLADYRTLQSRLDQAHWDAISRDQTIENLRGENARYREALEWYGAHGGERARAALAEDAQ